MLLANYFMVNKDKFKLYWKQASRQVKSQIQWVSRWHCALYKLNLHRRDQTSPLCCSSGVRLTPRQRQQSAGVTATPHHSAAGPYVVGSEATWGHHSIVNRSSRWQAAVPVFTPSRHCPTVHTVQSGRMEGWVDLGGWLYTKMVYLPTGSHPS